MSQYYTVLHASPRNLYRFYSDASTLTFADIRPDGHHSTKTVTTQKVLRPLVGPPARRLQPQQTRGRPCRRRQPEASTLRRLATQPTKNDLRSLRRPAPQLTLPSSSLPYLCAAHPRDGVGPGL